MDGNGSKHKHRRVRLPQTEHEIERRERLENWRQFLNSLCLRQDELWDRDIERF